MMRRLLFDRSGASAAEFALVLPLLLLFLFGIIDAGRFLWTYNQLEKATQVGARVAVVTTLIPGGLAATNYVGVGGLTQGDVVPASALGEILCTKSGSVSCSCAVTPCPSTLTPYNSGGYDLMKTRMQSIYPLNDANIRVRYRGSGMGFAGDPNGSDIAPLVTVEVTGVSFVPITTLLFATIAMPTLGTTLGAEDLSGSVSN